MQALPDVESLSSVEEKRLLKLWEGLGYYSRARNLKRAAALIMERYGGAHAAILRRTAQAAWHWSIYGRRDCVDRIWAGRAGGRWQCAARTYTLGG